MGRRARTLLRINVPLALLFLVAVYGTLQVFLLDGSGLVCSFLGLMTAWSLTVATLSHPGKIRPNDLGPASEQILAAVAASTGAGRLLNDATVTELLVAKDALLSPTDVSYATVAESVGHFVPKRQDACADLDGPNEEGNVSGAHVPSNLSVATGGLLSAAISRLNTAYEAGMVTPTLSEASFATTAASSKSKASKKDKQERREAKERVKREKKLLKELRKKDPLFCRSCEQRRPMRTHHCRVCDDCVVRYDHHCIWIDNCIGASNLKAFYLFVVYTCLGILHYLWSVASFLRSGHVFATIRSAPMGYVLALLLMAFTPLVLGASYIAFSFFFNTTMGLLGNYTAYEKALEGDTLARFDRGHWLLNCKEALGDNVYQWWMPTLVKDKIHAMTKDPQRFAFDAV